MLLADLLDRTGLSVLDHLERQVTVPVIDGVQAQGDLVVVPLKYLPEIGFWGGTSWPDLPAKGLEVVRGVAGGNTHMLVADRGTCRFTTSVRDDLRLTVVVVANTAPAFLIHPEHGAAGIAPGRWVVRRQRELVTVPRRTGPASAFSRYSFVED